MIQTRFAFSVLRTLPTPIVRRSRRHCAPVTRRCRRVLHAALVLIHRPDPTESELAALRVMFAPEIARRRCAEAVAVAILGAR